VTCFGKEDQNAKHQQDREDIPAADRARPLLG
jgi:hypothetical protein